MQVEQLLRRSGCKRELMARPYHDTYHFEYYENSGSVDVPVFLGRSRVDFAKIEDQKSKKRWSYRLLYPHQQGGSRHYDESAAKQRLVEKSC
jgi:hypothetical protein